MSGDDLIRRADALEAVDANTPRPAGGPFSHTNSMRVIAADVRKAIAALPADRIEADAAEIAALQSRVAALVEAAKGLGRWCVKELPPHPDLTPLLVSLDAAITAAKGESHE